MMSGISAKQFWGLMYSIHREQLLNKTNVMVLLVHYLLVRRGMKNAGLGCDLFIPNETDTRDVLPEGWNGSLPCRMRYLYNKILYLLSVHPADYEEYVYVNLIRPCDSHITASRINLKEVAVVKGRLVEMLPTWTDIFDRITNELITPMLTNVSITDIHSQAESRSHSARPYQHNIRPAHSNPPARGLCLDPPRAVGSNNLQPFGGERSMVFERSGLGPRPNPRMISYGFVPRFQPMLPGHVGIPFPPRSVPPRGEFFCPVILGPALPPSNNAVPFGPHCLPDIRSRGRGHGRGRMTPGALPPGVRPILINWHTGGMPCASGCQGRGNFPDPEDRSRPTYYVNFL